MIEYKVKYVGDDSADLRTGEVYLARQLKDSRAMIGVKDRSGEWYAYPAALFEAAEKQKD